MSVLDACLKISANSGWGALEEAAFKSSTVEEFENVLRNSPADKFPSFMRQMMRFVAQSSDYRFAFGDSVQFFIEACRKVCRDPEATRLKMLVEDMFRGAGQSALLQTSAPSAETAPGG